MKVINHELIQLARNYRGESQSSLAAKIGITQGYLSKIEQGFKSPETSFVNALSEKLNLPIEFFFQSDRIYGLPVSVHPMYRKPSSVGVKDVTAVQAELNIRIMHVRRLLKSVDVTRELTLPELDIDEFGGDPEAIADLVRRMWLIPRGPINNLTDYVERAGVLVIDTDFNGANIDGVTYNVPGVPPCIFLNVNRPGDRRRFTLAHELGHLVMHKHPTPQMEEEANAFASALLMPAVDIGSQLTKLDLAKVAQLKPIWKMSMASIIMRASTLGKLTESQKIYLWRQMGPYRKKEPPHLDIEKEATTAVNELLKLHETSLGYSVTELSKLIHVHTDEFRKLYGYETRNKAGLRLVR